MTEEERFQKVYNIYMNFEAELATRGMDGIPPIAASLTQAYIVHEIKDLIADSNTSVTVTGDGVSPLDILEAVPFVGFEEINLEDENWKP